MRANALLCLIDQANYLLDKQIAALEKQFIEDGGYSEQLAAARLAERDRESRPPVGRHSRLPRMRQGHGPAHGPKGQERRQAVLGLLGYPECNGVVDV